MRLLERVYLIGSGQIGLSHPFDCHVYLVDGGDELALIDSGAGVDTGVVLENIRLEGCDPAHVTRILLTHHHADHSGGCWGIREATSARVGIHHTGAPYVEEGGEEKMGLDVAKRSGLYAPDYTFPPCPVDDRLEDGQVIRVGRLELKTIHVPGHSFDALCYYLEEDGLLFSGDVVFFGGRIGLLNRSCSSLEDYRNHFGRIAGLAVDALLPGHGLPVLRGGRVHVEKAAAALIMVQLPPNFL